MATRPVILLVSPLDADSEARLTQGADVRRPAGTDQAALIEAIADCDGMIARTNTPVTRELLQAGQRLKVVGVAGVGIDRVDCAAAAELGIDVCNTPAAASDAVAELTVALMLTWLRPIARLAQEYRAGHYRAARSGPHGHELRAMTVGLIGLGRIGSRVARICSQGCGARVLYNDIVDVDEGGLAIESVSKPELYRQSDIISLHPPLTDETRGLMNAETLAECKSSALLVNAARGAIVDTDALVAALESDQLGGAALDVTDPEPLPPDHPLFHREDCLLTPHIAARTFGGLQRMFGVVDDVLQRLSKM